MKRRIFRSLSVGVLSVTMGLLCGCKKTETSTAKDTISVMIEEGANYAVPTPVQEITRGSDVTFEVMLLNGCSLTGVSYSESKIEEHPGYSLLTLMSVLYPTVVSLTASVREFVTYDANGGQAKDSDGKTAVSLAKSTSHLRANSALGNSLFKRDGYLQDGWNTKADGSGEAILQGSRMPNGISTLYAHWVKETDSSCFEYEILSDNTARINSLKTPTDPLVIPHTLAGHTVSSLGSGSLAHQTLSDLYLPETLERIENGAFQSCTIKTLTLFDNLAYLDDASFVSSPVTMLRIQAYTKPCYSGTYFDAFQDKLDYLDSIKDQKKIVLFSGSSARYGYYSPQLAKDYPSYKVVNMGVFAYFPALVQLDIIRTYLLPGDVVIDSPEFDAYDNQFCYNHAFEDRLFAMMESGYQVLTLVDLTRYTEVFSSFYRYISNKKTLPVSSYQVSAKHFDDDMNTYNLDTYNAEGDFILPRNGTQTEGRIFQPYLDLTLDSYQDTHLTALNQAAKEFTDQGISFYFTFSPRNKDSLTENSTSDKRALLESHLREILTMPILCTLEDLLLPAGDFYLIDNHLTTAGASWRTDYVSKALKAYLA
jgi:hypothetical protein